MRGSRKINILGGWTVYRFEAGGGLARGGGVFEGGLHTMVMACLIYWYLGLMSLCLMSLGWCDCNPGTGCTGGLQV